VGGPHNFQNKEQGNSKELGTQPEKDNKKLESEGMQLERSWVRILIKIMTKPQKM